MRFFLLRLALWAGSSALAMQGQAQGFLARYQQRVNATTNAQPHWPGPLVTSTPKVEQELRTDFTRQRNAQGFNTWNLGTGKGFQFVPLPRTQVTVSPPPFVDHTAPKQRDGFGDVGFQVKYRIFGRNETHGNAIVTTALNATVPTGKNGNGSCCALLSPLLEAGKGWGRFDVVSAVSGTLPMSNTAGLGRSIAFNTAGQYHVSGGSGFQLWSEIESNTLAFYGGSNDGKTQHFLLPGLTLRRIPLSPDRLHNGKRTIASVGLGMQFATTHFHTYDHALIITLHLPF